MRVVKIVDPGPGEPVAVLVDSDGAEVMEVSEFLRTLTVRRYSPNTVRAYAYDLRRLMLFLNDQGLTVGEFIPAQAVEFLATLRRTPSERRLSGWNWRPRWRALGCCPRGPATASWAQSPPSTNT